MQRLLLIRGLIRGLRLRVLLLVLLVLVDSCASTNSRLVGAVFLCAGRTVDPALAAAAKDLLAGPEGAWQAELARWLPAVGAAGRCALEQLAAGNNQAVAARSEVATASSALTGAPCSVDPARRNGCLESRARRFLAEAAP